MVKVLRNKGCLALLSHSFVAACAYGCATPSEGDGERLDEAANLQTQAVGTVESDILEYPVEHGDTFVMRDGELVFREDRLGIRAGSEEFAMRYRGPVPEAQRIARERERSLLPTAPDPTPSLSEKLAAIVARSNEDLIQVTLEFDSTGLPPIPNFRELGDEEFQVALHLRESEVDRVLGPRIDQLRALGTITMTPLWINNSIQASVPRGQIDLVLGMQGLVHLSGNAEGHPSWNGAQIRDAVRSQGGMDAWINGGRSFNPRMKVAILEVDAEFSANYPLRNHPAFTDGFVSRFAQVYDCNTPTSWFLGIPISWGCVNTATPGDADHATIVSWLAGGNITYGQDPAVTTSSDQRERSAGAVPMASLYYSHLGDCDAFGRALQKAVADEIDVVNMSFGFWNGDSPSHNMCDLNFDCGGVNSSLSGAMAAGVTLVAAAGNDEVKAFAAPYDCKIGWPAFRPEVIAVGSMDTDDSPWNSDYTAHPMSDFSSRGPMPIRYLSGVTNMVQEVDTVTAGHYRLWPTVIPPGSTFGYANGYTQGTSFAAPIVAGGLAQVVNGFEQYSFGTPSPHVLTAHTLLFSDGWNGSTGGSSARLMASLDTDTGAGRYRQFFPANFSMTAPWAWGYRSVALGPGTYSFTVSGVGAEDPGSRQERVAVYQYSPDLNNIRCDFILSVVDACVGWRPTIQQDASYDVKKKVEVSGTQLCPTGLPCRCLEVDISVYPEPGVSTCDFYIADFIHGGNPAVN